MKRTLTGVSLSDSSSFGKFQINNSSLDSNLFLNHTVDEFHRLIPCDHFRYKNNNFIQGSSVSLMTFNQCLTWLMIKRLPKLLNWNWLQKHSLDTQNADCSKSESILYERYYIWKMSFTISRRDDFSATSHLKLLETDFYTNKIVVSLSWWASTIRIHLKPSFEGDSYLFFV